MVAKRSSPALALLLVVPSAACALGLGDIRLRSRLDQPLDAQIALLDATPDAMQSLDVKLAPQDAFAQYGLSWAPYLTGIHLKTVRNASGQEVVQLSSDQPITDPVVTLLVEATWNRGRLIREYTVLLDPPLFVPNQNQAAQPAVAPAVTGPGAREGEIGSAPPPPTAQPEPTGQAASSPSPAPEQAGATATPGSLHVHAGETLSGIASRIAGAPLNSGRTGQWMVAIYHANPQAFDHNMNLLRSGTILRVPSAATAGAISSASAWGEIRAQYAAWRGAAGQSASTGSGPGRLRLVAPSSGSGTAAGGTGSSGQIKSLQQQVSSLQSQLSDSQRLLHVKEAELAKLQAQFGPHAQPAPAPAVAPPAASAPAAAKPAPAERPAAAVPPPSAPPPAPQVSPPAHAPASRVTPKPFQPSSGGSLFGTLMDYWWVAALLVLALIGYLGSRFMRSRRQAELDDSLGRLAAAGEGAAARQAPRARQESSLGDTTPMRRAAADHDADAFIVEESGTHERPRLEESSAQVVAKHISADQTISSETAINLEQGDPLAEADFHMAYGLYDQAADLIRIAISREPERRDLKLKLLEIFFVWGNKEQFLQTAHELAGTRADAAPGEWEKIVIMGKQLAPEDPLFASGATVSGAASAGVDLDLEGGDSNAVDFDVMGGSPAATGERLSAATLDLDIGSALGEPDTEATAESPGAATDRNMALSEEGLADGSTGSTREMTATLPGGQESGAEFGTEVEGPTVEQPALNVSEPLRERVEIAMRQSGAEQTAELAIDDLGLDLGAFEGAPQTADQAAEEAGSESPTLVAGLDEETRRLMQQPEDAGTEAAPHTGTTNAWQLDEKELEAMLTEGEGSRDTAATSKLDALDGGGVDFDIGEAADETAHGGNGAGLDLDVGTATVPDATFVATQKLSSEELALPDLEPVTMSEVGTKLDLARAYMDMGDPEGARNILEEVLSEGSAAQRQEAERLMESLPG